MTQIIDTMENVINAPGLHHIPENVFSQIEFQDLVANLENLLDSIKFWRDFKVRYLLFMLTYSTKLEF